MLLENKIKSVKSKLLKIGRVSCIVLALASPFGCDSHQNYKIPQDSKLAYMDDDGNGKITYQEYCRDSNYSNQCNESFKDQDYDGNGYLDMRDF